MRNETSCALEAPPSVAEAVIASFPLNHPHRRDDQPELGRGVEYRADGFSGCFVARLPRHRKAGHRRFYGRRN